MIIEAKKTYDLLSGSWRTRKVYVVIYSGSESLRTQESTSVHSWENMDVSVVTERACLSFAGLFVLFRALTDWMTPIYIAEVSLPYSAIDSNANLFWNTLADTLRYFIGYLGIT